MQTKNVYSYSKDTGEYSGETVAFESPLEPGVFHIPAYATETETPPYVDGEVLVYDAGADRWLIKADFRGSEYYDTETQERHVIEEIGIEPDKAWTNITPDDSEAVWTGRAWEVPFDKLKVRKKTEIAAARYVAETAGITLNGITIETDRQSQALITGAIVQSLVDPAYSLQWKTPTRFIPLTGEQLKEVGAAVRKHVQDCFDKEAELLKKIDAAKDMEELAAVVW